MKAEENLDYWRERALKAETDANRYRWLRDGGICVLPYNDYGAGPEFPAGDELDIIIDDNLKGEA